MCIRDSTDPVLRAVGCAAQIELGKVARPERKSEMRGGRERRDVCGSGRRTRARHDDEGWRRIHRLRRVHEACTRDAGKASPALDSQIHRVFLTVLFSRALPQEDVIDHAKKAGMSGHGGLRIHGGPGDRFFSRRSRRWNKTIATMRLPGRQDRQ